MKGYVYIMSNPSHTGYKIGMTTRTPEERASELYTTGVMFPFTVEFSILVADCAKIEKRAHRHFKGEHIIKEYFDVDLDTAIAYLNNIAEDIYVAPVYLTYGRGTAYDRENGPRRYSTAWWDEQWALPPSERRPTHDKEWAHKLETKKNLDKVYAREAFKNTIIKIVLTGSFISIAIVNAQLILG